MADVLKSAALYTVYALVVGLSLQGLSVLIHTGGAVASDAFQMASEFATAALAAG